MKSNWRTTTGRLAAVLLFASILGLVRSTSAQEPTFWVRDLQQAQRIAAERRCLVLIHFWNYNCGPCVAVDRKVFSQPNVIQSVSANYVGVRVNVTELPELKRQFNIDRWPVDVIVTPVGEEVYRAVSEQEPDRYVALLDRVAAHRRIGMKPPRDSVDRQQPYATDTSAQVNNSGPLGGRELDNTGYAAGGPAWANESAARAQAESIAPDPRSQNAGQWQPSDGTLRGGGAFPPPPNAASEGATEPYRGRPDLYRPPEGDLRNNNVAGRPDSGLTSPANAASGRVIANSTRGPAWNQSPSAGGARNPVAALPPGSPPLGLDGFCPVTLLERRDLKPDSTSGANHGQIPESQRPWVKGDPRWGAIHRNRTYLFASEAARQKFMQHPDLYSPMLSGYDPVLFIEQGQLVEGRRDFGIWHGDQMYLFADEDSLKTFWNHRDNYSGKVKQAMRGDDSGRIQR